MIVMDLFGTILRDKMVNDAQVIRNKILDLNLEVSEQDKSKDSHYEKIIKRIEDLFYIPKEVRVQVKGDSPIEVVDNYSLERMIQTNLFLYGFLYILKNSNESYLIEGSKEFLDKFGNNVIILSNVIYPILDTLTSYYNINSKYKFGQALNLEEDDLALKKFNNSQFKKVIILEKNAELYKVNLEEVNYVVGDDLLKEGLLSFYISEKYNPNVVFYHYKGKGSNQAGVSYSIDNLKRVIMNSSLDKVLGKTKEELLKRLENWYKTNYKTFENFKELKL